LLFCAEKKSSISFQLVVDAPMAAIPIPGRRSPEVLDYLGHIALVTAFALAGTVWIRDHGCLHDLTQE